MKSVAILAVSLFILVTFGLNAQTNGYWKKAKGPDGLALYQPKYGLNAVTVTTTLNGKIYALNKVGDAYRSVDNGLNWTKFDNPVLDASAVQPGNLIIGQTGMLYKVLTYTQNSINTYKLYRSEDDGATWQLRNANVPVHNIFESADGALFGTRTQAMFKSIDGGITWQQINTGPNYADYDSFIQYNNGIIQLYHANLTSFDEGLTWDFIYLDLADVNFCTSTGTIFTAYVDDNSGQLMRTADKGITWTAVNYPGKLGVHDITERNGRLVMATTSNICTSDDDGLTWQILPVDGLRPYRFATVNPLPNGDLLGESEGALIRSSDGGSHWVLASSGIQQPLIHQAAWVNDSIQFAVATPGLWKTINGGQDWSLVLADTAGYNWPNYNYYPSYAYQPLALVNKDTFLLISEGGKRLWRTFNGGITFEERTPADSIENRMLSKSTQGNRIFCTTKKGLEYTDDFGDSWQQPISSIYAQFPLACSSGKIYATNTGNIGNGWVSSDNGQHWSPIPNFQFINLTSNQFFELETDQQGIIYVLYYDYDQTKQTKIAVSKDNGQSWVHHIIPNDNTNQHNAIHINSKGQLFLTSYPNKILSSIDQGQSWFYLPQAFDQQNEITDVFISPKDYLYCTALYGGVYRTTQSTTAGAYITGSVNKDGDGDCSTHDAQQPLHDWIITAEGANDYVISTGANGKYQLFADTGAYTLKLHVPEALWWSGCDSIHSVVLHNLSQVDTADFTAKAAADCPLMSVDVSMPHLRRCFDNSVYFKYCNQGTETALNPYLDIKLDPHMSLVYCPLPHGALATDSFRVYLDTVISGDCRQFSITVHLSCDSTVIGQTHCVTAHAYPDTLCAPAPGWSGANIAAKVTCQDSVVRLQLKNTGSVPSQTLPYIIIEDDVVLLNGQRSYDPGETWNMNVPANGHTWRIESQQEPGHPFSTRAVGFEEGCGGFVTLGYINQFTVNGRRPSWDTECRQSVASFDPNDKQGYPLGYTSEHLIRSGQELEYTIRFQNTGTDTAFIVVVRDTLSALLDPTTVRPGASSHPYQWSLRDASLLSFTFNDIELLDSTTSLAGSEGFVTFRIRQKPGLQEGQTIFNKAGIYFDFNDPVLTNETWHTIAPAPTVAAENPFQAGKNQEVVASPNPMQAYTVFSRTDSQTFRGHQLILTDVLGHVVQTAKMDGPQVRVLRQGLPAGIYYYRVEGKDRSVLGVGKLMME